MSVAEIKSYLLNNGLIKDDKAIVSPLAGGVSSEIYLVINDSYTFVVKKALSKLNVKTDWYANISRNDTEQEYIAYVNDFLPGIVPEILYSDPQEGLFIMEYLGEGFTNWKSMLLQKQVNEINTIDAAEILAAIHSKSWNDMRAREKFNTNCNFYELRLEPYLIATAEKHPALKELFVRESDRLSQTHQCLIHGDFSPKNILVSAKRMVLLDCEVAWYGDPAFDVAFFMNHFLLKSLHLFPDHERYISQIMIFRNRYQNTFGNIYHKYKLESRISHLLFMLLLARIDGKSPVEYLKDVTKKEFIRTFVITHLPEKVDNLHLFIELWKKDLNKFLEKKSIVSESI